MQQWIIKCYILLLPQLNYIYWLIHFIFGWVQDVPLQIDTLRFLKFKQRFLKMKSF